ncbi:MAG: ATP/GTP-binding protein [Candidatus Nezhaarchaeota archaeon]|nr:ATP/GTP-binding protein [Candidatus Nezhaarchaeota archaeon]
MRNERIGVGMFMFYVYFVGTAGSGKSTLVDVFSRWLRDRDQDVVIVNLDPGAKWLPYGPDIDVREYISFERVMTELTLGPNGAFIACADMIASFAEKLKEEAEKDNPTYVLVDTPGQMELFAFREAGRAIISTLCSERTVVVYLIDASLMKKPSSLAASLLLSASVRFSLLKPQVCVLSKSDLLTKKDREIASRWFEHIEYISNIIGKEENPLLGDFSRSIMQVLTELESLTNIIPVSSVTGEGLDELFAELQRIFAGGGEEFVDVGPFRIDDIWY